VGRQCNDGTQIASLAPFSGHVVAVEHWYFHVHQDDIERLPFIARFQCRIDDIDLQLASSESASTN
jgi:hypothetical protein